MAVITASPHADSATGGRWVAIGRIPLLAAPIAAVAAGLAAQWLDFRELRVLLLTAMGIGVLGTAWAVGGAALGLRPALRTALIGILAWAGAQTVYVVVHVALGEPFDAGRFGPQWSQAIGLIAAHGIFLGLPTGILAAIALWLSALLRPTRVR